MDIKNNIERFNADLNQGLSKEQVELRKKQKLVNKHLGHGSVTDAVRKDGQGSGTA